jgi:hypothetical protein
MDADQASRSAIANAARRLLPFLCLCYAVNFLDWVNVGIAALSMNQDLGLTPSIFGTGRRHLSPVRSAEQSRAAAIRRAGVDRAPSW